MTRDEAIKILAVIKAAFPASYRNMTRDEANGTVMVWASQFANDPAEVVMIAVQKLIATSQFPPTIADVKSKMRGLYWESWMAVRQHDLGLAVMSAKQLEATTAVMNACERYNREASAEPKLCELMNGLQNFLTDGGGK